jgi:PrtD family type I secretion system ABC transporter
MGMKTRQSELSQALSGCQSGLIAVAAFSAFINLLMLVTPLYMLQVYDRVLMSRSVDTLLALSLLAASLLVVMALLEAVRSRILVRLAGKIDLDYSQRILNALFRANLLSAGRGSSQSVQDFDTVRQFLSGPPLIALLDSPWVPLFLVVIFLFHPLLGVIATGGAIFILAVALFTEFLTRPRLQQASTEAIKLSQFVDRSLRNAEVVQGMGMYGDIERRWRQGRDSVLALQSIASDRAGVLKGLSKSARLLLQVAILGVGAYLAIHDRISPGAIIASAIIMGRALAPVESAIGSWPQMIAARDAYERLRMLLGEFPVEPAKTSLPPPKGEILVRDLVAVAPGGKVPVLRQVGFAVPAGKILGIVGPSGAGKSTLARLLIGAWAPFAGSVRLDNAEISAWPRAELGPYVGYLPQDIELFDGTVSENIARFGEINSHKVVGAAQTARVHDMILQLSNGYDTEIGPGGSILSAGQRQRIALARALYGDPTLIVLDEPNSNLDEAGDVALVGAIAEMRSRGSTVVIISHRPSVLQQVDFVLVLNKGTMQSFGPREEVLARFMRPQVVAPSGAAKAQEAQGATALRAQPEPAAAIPPRPEPAVAAPSQPRSEAKSEAKSEAASEAASEAESEAKSEAASFSAAVEIALSRRGLRRPA